MSLKRPSPGAEPLRTPSQPPRQTYVSSASLPVNSGPALRSLPVNSSVWALKSNTCLSLGLDPSESSHSAVICNKCTHYWETKLRRNVKLTPQRQRSVRMSCERPFDCADTADPYKRRLCDRFKSLFSWTLVAAASAGPASVGHCVTPSN